MFSLYVFRERQNTKCLSACARARFHACLEGVIVHNFKRIRKRALEYFAIFLKQYSFLLKVMILLPLFYSLLQGLIFTLINAACKSMETLYFIKHRIYFYMQILTNSVFVRDQSTEYAHDFIRLFHTNFRREQNFIEIYRGFSVTRTLLLVEMNKIKLL